MKKTMKILSLFDGISVAQQALKELNIKVNNYFASEIDSYCQSVTQHNFPNTIQLGSVCDVSVKKYPEINNPDLMILGSPCQDLSISNKNRTGLKGARSGLFWEAIRIHKEVKPKWFVYENVSSMKKEWKQQMLEAIQEIEPNTYMIEINASLVSAQSRKRVFFTNIPNIEQPEDRGILLKDILEENVDDKYNMYPRNIVRKSEKSMQWDMSGKGYCSQQDRANGLLSKSATIPHGARNKVNVFYENIVRRTTPVEKERLQSLPDNYTYGIDSKREAAIGNAFNCEVIKHILKSML